MCIYRTKLNPSITIRNKYITTIKYNNNVKQYEDEGNKLKRNKSNKNYNKTQQSTK